MTRGVGLCVGLVLFAARAEAAVPILVPHNGGGADLELFRPASDSMGYLSVEGSRVLERGHIEGRFVGSFGVGSTPLMGESDAIARDAVPVGVTGSVFGTVGLGRLQLALELPIAILDVDRRGDPYSGRDGRIPGLRHGPAEVGEDPCGVDPTNRECRTTHSSEGLSDPAAVLKLQASSTEEDSIGLAVVLRAAFPSGAAPRLIADPGGSHWPLLVLEASPTERIRLALNVGYRWVLARGSTFGKAGDPGRFTYGDQATGGFAARVGLLRWLDVLASIYASRLLAEAEESALSCEAIGGLVFHGGGITVSPALGGRIVHGFDAAGVRGVIVLAVDFETADLTPAS
jgi:hypothetical protein